MIHLVTRDFIQMPEEEKMIDEKIHIKLVENINFHKFWKKNAYKS